METFDVAVVILIDGPRTLVNKRPEGGYHGGWWEWPGGKRLPDETFEQCAQREVREELGLELENLQEFTRTRAQYPGRLVNLVFFTAQVKPGSTASFGALEHRWLTAAEVRKLKFLVTNLPVLDRLEQQME